MAGSWRFGDRSVTCFGAGLPAEGAIFILQEWTFPLVGAFPSSSEAAIRSYPPRPEAFRLTPDERNPEKQCADRPVFDLPFQDAGRFFYFEVIFGSHISDRGMADLLRVLDSLHVDRA